MNQLTKIVKQILFKKKFFFGDTIYV